MKGQHHMKGPDADEIQALHRLLIYARLEAERLELWAEWNQLKLIEGMIAERLRDAGYGNGNAKS
jgi:hypothetical protein